MVGCEHVLFDAKTEQHNAEYTMNGGLRHVLCDAKAEQHNAECTMNGGLRTCVV